MVESSLAQKLDAAEIEAELKDLWSGIARQREEHEEELLRACVVNLVVCSRVDEEVDQTAADLSAAGGRQPGRIILLLTEEESPMDGFETRVATHCHKQPGGRQQICGQTIRILAHGEAAERSASVVPPLLVPDLPVFVWWRRPLDADSPLLGRLLKISDRLIVDSSSRGVDELIALSRLPEVAEDVALIDLAWPRLGLWRRAVAGLYDAALTRSVLTRPRRIRLHFGSGEDLPTPVIYLLSWMASRLGWEVRSPLTRVEEGYCLAARTRDHDFQIELHRGQERGPAGLELLAAGDLRVALRRFESKGAFLEVRVERGGSRRSHQILPEEAHEELDLVAAELEISGRDRVFREALAFAAELFR